MLKMILLKYSIFLIKFFSFFYRICDFISCKTTLSFYFLINTIK